MLSAGRCSSAATGLQSVVSTWKFNWVCDSRDVQLMGKYLPVSLFNIILAKALLLNVFSKGSLMARDWFVIVV